MLDANSTDGQTNPDKQTSDHGTATTAYKHINARIRRRHRQRPARCRGARGAGQPPNPVRSSVRQPINNARALDKVPATYLCGGLGVSGGEDASRGA